jgi:MFS family permease
MNAFVGGMFGMERAILPPLAKAVFHLETYASILSFIISFGMAKAISNFYAGRMAERFGRKKTLLAGWIFGLPVPFLLMFSNEWVLINIANVLLGINQGLAWSSTLLMKIDIAGKKRSGFAAGLNEFSGYLAVAGITYLTSYLASSYGLRPYPFVTGIVLAVAGISITIFFIRETKHLGHKESGSQNPVRPAQKSKARIVNFRVISQSGFVNNLNDGMIWGLLPLYLTAMNFSFKEMGLIAAVYPGVWGIMQVFTGYISDKKGRKAMIGFGMIIQGIALVMIPYQYTLSAMIVLMTVMGAGTAMVYPTFIAAIADNTDTATRSRKMGIFRLYRDSGYVAGAVLTALLTGFTSTATTITAIAAITFLSGITVLKYYRKEDSVILNDSYI